MSKEARPWTEEDERRINGSFSVKADKGQWRRLRPHVRTDAGLFFLGTVPIPPQGEVCRACGACKVWPLPEAQGPGKWCSGCGKRDRE